MRVPEGFEPFSLISDILTNAGEFHKIFLHLLGLLCTLWLWKGFVFGQSPEEVISVELVSTQSMIKAGTQGWLGLKVKLAPDWHIYWKNSGKVDIPPRLLGMPVRS